MTLTTNMSWLRSKFQKAESRLEAHIKRMVEKNLCVEAERLKKVTDHDVQQPKTQKPQRRELQHHKTKRYCKPLNGTLQEAIGTDSRTPYNLFPTLESLRYGCLQDVKPTVHKAMATTATIFGT